MEVVEKMKKFLLEPSKAFDSVKKETVGEAFKYFLVPLLIGSLLSAVVFAIAAGVFMGFLGMMWGSSLGGLVGTLGAGLAGVIYFIVMIVGGIVGTLIFSLWIHIWIYLVGGRKGLNQTIKAMMYGATPSLLLSWLPVINSIGVIWSIVLQIIGIKKLHEITTGRAVVAAILAIVIPAIIIFIFFLATLTMVRPTY